MRNIKKRIRQNKQSVLTSLWRKKDKTINDDDVVVLHSSPPKSKKPKGLDVSSVKLSTKKTAWVSSAFDGFDDFDMGIPTTQPLNKAKKAVSAGQVSLSQSQLQPESRKRPRDISSQFAHTTPKPVQRRRPDVETDLWADKYTPKTQAELAAHKKKIQEVESWLIRTFDSQRKLTYNPDSYKRDWSRTDSGMDWASKASLSLVSSQDFLQRANRYQSLQNFVRPEWRRNSHCDEDFPNVFFRDVSVFYEILRKYCRFGRCPLVFIISDSSGSDSNERLLFPKNLQEELQIKNISFNPIAMTSLTKVLTHLASTESSQGVHSFSLPSKPVIESLAMSCAGDIRGAINALQFACLKDTRDMEHMSYSKTKQKKGIKKQSSSLKSSLKKAGFGRLSEKSSIDNSENDMAAIGGRDTTIFLFRALGKILYCKRDDPATRTEVPKLPSHLSHLDRDPLQFSPEEIVEKCHLSGDFFNAYLHQNYLEFYSDISDVVQASEYLSDSDYLTVDWVSRSVLQEYATSVATRGLVHSNSSRSRYDSAKSGLGWKPLTKPQSYSTLKLARQNCETARRLFRGYAWEPKALQTEMMPYISLINVTLHDTGQIRFLQDMCRYSKTNCLMRSERLDENDVELEQSESIQISCSQSQMVRTDGGLETEDEVITNSQSKVKTQVEEDNELQIEEYDD
ncbi:hypothetical protein ScPMuIL_005320 [Solemya velum]